MLLLLVTYLLRTYCKGTIRNFICVATSSYGNFCSFSSLVQDIRARGWPGSGFLVSAISAAALLLFLRWWINDDCPGLPNQHTRHSKCHISMPTSHPMAAAFHWSLSSIFARNCWLFLSQQMYIGFSLIKAGFFFPYLSLHRIVSSGSLLISLFEHVFINICICSIRHLFMYLLHWYGHTLQVSWLFPLLNWHPHPQITAKESFLALVRWKVHSACKYVLLIQGRSWLSKLHGLIWPRRPL